MASFTAQKIKFSVKDLFSKCDQIRCADLVKFTEEIFNDKLFCAVLDAVCLKMVKHTLKAHRKNLKNGVSKTIVHVIKHANFQLYWVHPDN